MMKKIVVAQFWTRNLSYSKYTRLINEKYCHDNQYIYHVDDNDEEIINSISNRSFTWYKPILIKKVFDLYSPDYVLFLDADAIICNDSYKIEQFIDDNYDCIVTKDYGPSRMNAGVLLFKNSEWSKNFLSKWWEISENLEGPNGEKKGYYNHALWHDQTCFGYLYDNDNQDNKIQIIDNKILNGRVFRHPEDNNFIFHAFSYGMYLNRTIDNAYFKLFNVPIPQGEQLLDIVQHYGTDKHSGHNYFTLIYNELFRPLKTECKKFIEIGINDGESIKLWRDYFVNAEIIGIEYNLPYSLEKMKDDSKDRMVLLSLDQSKESDMEELSQKYQDVDVILDDGSHKMHDQQMTFAKLFKSLKSGGIYIIEDLHTSLEVVMPEKRIFEWGDSDKTITLNMLKDYLVTKKIISDFMTESEMEYLNNNIKSVEILQSRPDWSITSVIIKK